MQSSSVSILIVDDTKFSSAVIEKLLVLEGFTDIRIASAAIDALSMIKERNADILLADWLMPGMDGLALTQLVRELNRRTNSFTYVVLLTAKEGDSAFKEAFASGVDDFVGKADLKTHLVPRVNAARRIAHMQNALLQREAKLKDEYRSLTLSNQVDSASGAGNFVFMTQQLDRYLKQSRSRNGQIGLLICRIDNLDQLSVSHDDDFHKNILKQIATRLKECARPMDEVARLNSNSLALAIYSNGNQLDTRKLIKRVEDAVLTSAYDTADGYISLVGTLQLDLINGDIGAPDTAEDLLNDALWRLSNLTGGPAIHHWITSMAEQ